MSNQNFENPLSDKNEMGQHREMGYYWVMHDGMWFVAYYNPSDNEFYFSGQSIGFDPQRLDTIDERKIERNS